ncbi:MAG: hypothetical protein V8Q76_07175 [Bacteroides intestinalis]
MNERRKPIRHAERSRSIYSPRKRKGKRFFDKLRMTKEKERMKVTDRRKENRLMKTMEFNEARRAAMARTIAHHRRRGLHPARHPAARTHGHRRPARRRRPHPDRRRTRPRNAAMVIGVDTSRLRVGHPPKPGTAEGVSVKRRKGRTVRRKGKNESNE